MPLRSNRLCARIRFSLLGGCIGCLAWAPPSGADPPALDATSIEKSSADQALTRSPETREALPQAQPGPARYDWRRPPPTEPDWPGVRRDIGYFLGYQFVALGVLYVAPESVSGWDSESKDDYSFSKWRDNTSKPVWDEDRWWINYVTHPYWGGAYYIQARERGLDRPRAFWYSALLSTLYEYGAESLAEPVSIQDLVVTPVAGFFVGEYLFAPLRERIRAKPGRLRWTDKSLLFITNPLGVINARLDGWLGVESTLGWQPLGLQSVPTNGLGRDGLARPLSPVWGFQLHVAW